MSHKFGLVDLARGDRCGPGIEIFDDRQSLTSGINRRICFDGFGFPCELYLLWVIRRKKKISRADRLEGSIKDSPNGGPSALPLDCSPSQKSQRRCRRNAFEAAAFPHNHVAGTNRSIGGERSATSRDTRNEEGLRKVPSSRCWCLLRER